MNALLRAWIGGGEGELRGRLGEIPSTPRRQARSSRNIPYAVVVRLSDSPENAIQVLTDYPEDKVNAEYWYSILRIRPRLAV